MHQYPLTNGCTGQIFTVRFKAVAQSKIEYAQRQKDSTNMLRRPVELAAQTRLSVY
jgi:hypothetical protein